MTMQLKRLSIRAARSFDDFSGYGGEAEFESPHGEIKLTLDHRLSARVLAACADALVESASSQADALRDSAASAAGILIEHTREDT